MEKGNVSLKNEQESKTLPDNGMLRHSFDGAVIFFFEAHITPALNLMT